MSNVTIRVKPISAGAIKRAGVHNNRLFTELGYPTPDNIKTGQSVLNKCCVIKDGSEVNISLKEAIYYRIQKTGAQERKNSVMALEYVVSASPDFLKAYSPSKHFANCVTFLAEKHGRENIVAIAKHYDETNPHAHIIIVPIIKKEVRWKRSKGDGFIEGKTEENRLCARDFTGNRNLLRSLQDNYFNYCVPYGEECGVTIERGTPVEYQTKKYLVKTYHEMGLINEALEKNIQLMQEANQLYEKGKGDIKESQEYQKKLEEINEKNKKLQALKEKVNKDLNILLQQQGEKDKVTKLMKEGKEKEKKKGNDFDMGMGM